MLAIATLFASGGCTCCAFKYQSFAMPAEIAPCGVAERVLISPDVNVNLAEAVQKPAGQEMPALDASPSPVHPLPAVTEASIGTFGLPDAIAFGLANNPRLRAARAGIDRTRGQEQAAFAPFLPSVDLLSQAGVVTPTLAPGIPGTTGLILASGFGTRAYSETEASLQWMLYDFGRSSGRYGQAVARSQIAQLQLTRAVQTIEFDVATTYVDVLLARASRRVQDEAVLRADAILHDTNARRVSGVVLKEDVLRAEVQTSESREALVVAREGEFNSIARLNNAMGRNSGLPIEIVDLQLDPPMPATLSQLLETAAAQRPEIAVARQMVQVAQQGWKAARGELLPRIFVRASGGRTDGESVVTGWQEGAGLHIETPLYSGGRNQGEIRSAEADIQAALADAQTLLDNISLEVNIAYRGVVAARERIGLSRVAVTQAEENMRLIIVRYKNGNATPTDIVDSEAAMTRSQQRFYSATYTYLAALARLDYALGQHQGTLLVAQPIANNTNGPQQPVEELPTPRIRINEP